MSVSLLEVEAPKGEGGRGAEALDLRVNRHLPVPAPALGFPVPERKRMRTSEQPAVDCSGDATHWLPITEGLAGGRPVIVGALRVASRPVYAPSPTGREGLSVGAPYLIGGTDG